MSRAEDRLTYHVRQAMPSGWIMHRPLAFEGNAPGRFIARISGDQASSLAAEVAFFRHFEVEGYGDSEEAAIEDLLSKLPSR